MIRVLFICLGNICRSPMAEYVFRQQVNQAGLSSHIQVASAGTSGWHDGENMHTGTIQQLIAHGINPQGFHSRKIQLSDQQYDYLIVMDDANLHAVEQLFGKHPNKLFKLTELIPHLGYNHVPDPYYTQNFTETYELIQAGCHQLLQRIKTQHTLPTQSNSSMLK